MKKNYIYLFLAAAMFIASCKKSYLVLSPPGAVPVNQSIKTENDMADAVNGMYQQMRQFDFYGRDIPILGDLMADNIFVSVTNSGRYLSENNYTMTNQNGEALDLYTRGYATILQANRIIAATVPATANVGQLKGEAYIVRATAYLQLANFFGQPYTVDPTKPAVPLVTLPTNLTSPFILPARATVSAVYAKIISDLDSAYAIMPATGTFTGTALHPTNSEYIGRYVAKAMEARAYLYKGDYANALAAALIVINSGGYTLAPSTGLLAYWANPAARTDKLETIFELALTTVSNNGTNGLDAMYAQAGGGYGDMLVIPDLYALYAATDVRKGLIISGSPLHAGAVFYNNKNSNFTNPTDKDDIKVIRYAEVILTAAEAYAQTGDNVNGLLYLNLLAQKRDPSFTGYTDTGAALIADIIQERRKELAFEGLRYFDLTRTNQPIVRPQQGSVLSAPSIGLIPVGDPRRILPIPLAEINADPNETQNPGY